MNPMHTPYNIRNDLPLQWQPCLAGTRLEQQSIGESRADVYRVRSTNQPDRYLKSEHTSTLPELPDEIERLNWWAAHGLRGPSVRAAAATPPGHWLFMRAVVGQDGARAGLPPAQVVAIMADALHRLHRIPIGQCPFDQTLEPRIAEARRALDAGLVDESDFDDERIGRTAEDAFAELLATRPATHDLVVAHGDACLPNFMADGGVFTGYIDCGRLGVSDRHQDLALAARSIERNLGREWIEPFFRSYGVEPDNRRLAFYCLLDEFF